MILRLLAASAFAIAGLVGTTAWAHEPSTPIEQRLTRDEMHATGLDTLTPAQLELLNRLLRERGSSDAAAPALAGDAQASRGASAADAEPSVGRGTSDASPAAATARYEANADAEPGDVEPDLVAYIDANGRSLPRRAMGEVSGWAPGTVFTLDNGHQWKVLKGEVKLRAALHDPEVLLVPGVMGRWFLQVTEDMPKARVYRIR